jgi:phosphopantothenate-cysteine ligase
MNVLITAGGTIERVDSVRGITNFATGRLGSLIADCFAVSGEAGQISYICGRTALKPQAEKVEIIEIEGTNDLEKAIRVVLASRRVDAVIHSMAVSDYRVKTVTTMERLAASASALDRETKIRSDEENLVLILEPTVKIISLFKDLAPEAILVGFKLMDGVSHEPQPGLAVSNLNTLLDTAGQLLEKNRCTFVLANDKQDIHGDTHIGYLIDQNRKVRRYETKAAIAKGITQQVIAAYNAKGIKNL